MSLENFEQSYELLNLHVSTQVTIYLLSQPKYKTSKAFKISGNHMVTAYMDTWQRFLFSDRITCDIQHQSCKLLLIWRHDRQDDISLLKWICFMASWFASITISDAASPLEREHLPFGGTSWHDWHCSSFLGSNPKIGHAAFVNDSQPTDKRGGQLAQYF